MVLSRSLKQYKMLMRIMATQLVQHESIITTKSKAKHLKPFAQKLISMGKNAADGKTSPLNLLKGKTNSQKAYQKLLLQIVPRLKKVKGNYITISKILKKRRGDNAQIVKIAIKGNQQDEYEKRNQQQLLAKGQIINIKAIQQKILLEQKAYIEEKIEKQPHKSQYWQQQIKRIQHQQWISNKTKRQPPRYSLLL